MIVLLQIMIMPVLCMKYISNANVTLKKFEGPQSLMYCIIGESWSPQNHSYPEKMFPSNVLISLEAEKNPLSLIENPHKSPFRKFFYDHSKVELFSILCSNFYKKILSITRQRKDRGCAANAFFERSRFLP